MRQADEGTGGRVASLDDPAPNYTDDTGSDWLVRPSLVGERGRVKRLKLISPGLHDTERRFMTTEEAWADWTEADEAQAEDAFYAAADEAVEKLRDSIYFA